MNDELRYCLQRGPTSAKELARLTGLSISTIYKAVAEPGVETEETIHGKRFFIIPPETNSNGPEGEATASPQEPPATSEPVAHAPSKRGRPTSFTGKQLFAHENLLREASETGAAYYENPRRRNSAGFNSLEIIINHPGITTEEFRAQGGRMNDLRWDVEHGHVRVEG